jgi:hypothetical protein
LEIYLHIKPMVRDGIRVVDSWKIERGFGKDRRGSRRESGDGRVCWKGCKGGRDIGRRLMVSEEIE